MRKLGRLLAFVALLSMGMPPAWCCVWPARWVTPEAAPPVDDAPACPHCAPKPTPKPTQPCPPEPCCCVVDDAQVGAVERPAFEAPAAVWHPVRFDVVATAAPHLASRPAASWPNGPPLHVWNCVFTC